MTGNAIPRARVGLPIALPHGPIKKHQRCFVSLLTALRFFVLAVTGILAFVRLFSIGIVGLHALMGFVFVGLIALRVANNLNHLSQSVRSKVVWLTLLEARRE
jgi:hypothetical protein